MITERILNSIKNEDLKKSILFGLAFGLACGLACGLTFGLADGLAYGLIGGLVCGLVGGLMGGLVCGLAGGLVGELVCGLAYGFAGGLAFKLVGGLVCGLTFGLAYGLAYGLVNLSQITTCPLILLLVGVFVLSNILIFIFGLRNKKETFVEWLLKKELLGYIETLAIVINVLNIRWLIKHIDLSEYVPTIVQWIGYIGVGIVVIGCVIGLLYLKYKLFNRR